jgi:hypothetical protein
MASKAKLSQSTISRIWRAFALQPHRTAAFKLSKDPSLACQAAALSPALHANQRFLAEPRRALVCSPHREMAAVVRLAAVAVLMAATLSCCKWGDGVTLGPIERLNSEPSTLGLFSYPYYTSTHALEGGGAVTAWLRREGMFLPVVYRRAASDAAPFGPEAYLSPEAFRQTVSIVPTIVAGGDDLYAVWQARQPTSGSKFVLFTRSGDRGATWSEGHSINIRNGAFVPAIATGSAGRIYVAWTDERAGRRAVYFNRSLDGGVTWLPEDMQISNSERRVEAISVAIASDGADRVLVVWDQSARGGRTITAASSADSGATWTSPVQVDDGGNGPSPATPAAIFVGKTALVAWSAGSVAMSGGVTTFGQVWGDVSPDGGATWGTDVLIHQTNGGILPTLHLTTDGTRAHVIFDAGPATGGTNIYVVSTDRSPAWQADYVPTPISHGQGSFIHPRMAEDRRGVMFAVWEEGEKRIHFNHSIGDGARDQNVTWSERDEIIYEVKPPESAAAHYPQVAVADGVAYVTWEVWGAMTGQYKTFVDIERKVRPADLYVRRVTLAR